MVQAQRGTGRVGLAVLALSCMAPPLAAAEAGLRTVIAVSDPQRAGEAAMLSRAAMARGADARRLEAPAPDALAGAIADAQGGGAVMVLALSAASRVEAGVTRLYGFGAGPLALDRLLDDLAGAEGPPRSRPDGGAAPDAAAAGRGDEAVMPEGAGPDEDATRLPPAPVRVLMVLDACATDPASRSAGIAARPGLALALLPAPGQACPDAGGPGALAALADSLSGRGDLAGLARRTGAVWVMEPGAVLPDLRPPPQPTLIAGAASAPAVPGGPTGSQPGGLSGGLSGGGMIAGGGGDIILLPRGEAQVMRTLPVSEAGLVLASAAPAGSLAAAPVSASAADPARLAARPSAPGMPEPSIIVGSLRPPAEAAPTGLLGALTGGALGTGLEDRQRLRSEDADLYATLVEQGTFDPEAGALTAAIQTELSRMGCYAGGIDGEWGNGSRSGVDAYFREAGGVPLTREPEIALFRQIIAGREVTCPAPVARAPAASATAARAAPARASAPAAARQPAAQAPAAQQPAAPAAPGNLGNALRGTGIIR